MAMRLMAGNRQAENITTSGVNVKYLVTFLLLFAFAQAQQINYTFGKQTPSGANWSGAGITYLDTTTGTTNNIIVDLNDFYPFDSQPGIADSTGGGMQDEFFNIGTFYANFDNQGTASPTTDSLLYTVKAYPGVYGSSSKAISGVKWGTAVTLATIAARGDYLCAENVYTYATLYGGLPPEVIKLEIAPSGDVDTDDSTAVTWRFAYPAIHNAHKERKSD
jgi:hypothetical protein